MKRPWTRSEKWLFATPLLFGVIAVGVATAPRVVQRWQGYPTELPVKSGTIWNPIALSHDGQVLLAGTSGRVGPKGELGLVQRFDARTLKPLPRLGNAISANATPIRGVRLTSVALSNDGRTLACSSDKKRLTVFDPASGQMLWSARSEPCLPAFSPNSKWLAFNDSKDSVRVVQARTGKTVGTWEQVPALGRGVLRFSPDGRTLASKGPGLSRKLLNQLLYNDPPRDRGGHIELRRTTDWKVEHVLPLPNTSRIAFSPDGKNLVGIGLWHDATGNGYGDTVVRCFDVGSGEVKWEISSLGFNSDKRLRLSHEITYSPDGRIVAVDVSSPREEIVLLDAETGSISRTLHNPQPQYPGLNTTPEGLAFSPDGTRLFARGHNKILVWDLE